VDGNVGLVMAPGGRLQRALRFAFKRGRIAEVEIIGESSRLQELELGVLGSEWKTLGTRISHRKETAFETQGPSTPNSDAHLASGEFSSG
jgi:hypothetical protein